ncbi:MAG: glycosyltransferase family 4 protein [Bacteroidia bacterium]|nr:glycosyltransferase family 4 protein [Bacteroidia bacterium]
MKKVLIVTYYWPPSGGSGVQRWLKFVKYFREFGWEPVVYTAENGEYPVIDPSLEKDIPAGVTVLKQPIWEPYHLYKAFVGQKKEERMIMGNLSENKKSSFLSKVATFIRGNFFIPDARKFWIRPSARFLTEYIRKNPVDVLITTGPPHSMHMIGLKVQKNTGVKWVADFRDPWTAIDFYQDLMLTPVADAIHRSMEKKVLKNADAVLVVSQLRKYQFEEIYAREYEVITNGYDETDIQGEIEPDNTFFTISHIGLMNKDRNHPVFWEALSEMVRENPVFGEKLKIHFVGKADSSLNPVIDAYGMRNWVSFTDYLPHKEVVTFQKKSHVLYIPASNVFSAKLQLPAKLFEYMAVRRPVLCIGPEDSDVAFIIKESQSGYVSDFKDKEKLKQHLNLLFSQYQNGTLSVQPKGIEKYSRRNLTQRMATLLNNLTGKG